MINKIILLVRSRNITLVQRDYQIIAYGICCCTSCTSMQRILDHQIIKAPQLHDISLLLFSVHWSLSILGLVTRKLCRGIDCWPLLSDSSRSWKLLFYTGDVSHSENANTESINISNWRTKQLPWNRYARVASSARNEANGLIDDHFNFEVEVRYWKVLWWFPLALLLWAPLWVTDKRQI